MSVERKESFQKVRDFCQEIANKTKCELNVSRFRGRATYFEIVPEGSSYGARVRLNDAQIKDGLYIQNILQGSDNILLDIQSIKDKM